MQLLVPKRARKINDVDERPWTGRLLPPAMGPGGDPALKSGFRPGLYL